MSEDKETPVESGTELPGGFESVDAMYETLQKMKDDLSEHKTRKTELTALQEKLQAYEDAEAKRLDAERSELEKAQARIAALEDKIKQKEDALSAAQRATIFERELSERLAGKDEKYQKLARRQYEAAVKLAGNFADRESLAELLKPIDDELAELFFR